MRESTVKWTDFIAWAFYFPSPGVGSYYVVQRNFFQVSYSLWTNLLLLGIEPLFYLVAFGFGLGFYLGDVMGVPYLNYFGVSLIFISGLMNTYTESTQSLAKRMKNFGSYSPYLFSPVPLRQIALGEILWGTLKGFIASVIVSVVLVAMGTVSPGLAIVALMISFSIYWIFSAMGVLVTSSSYHKNLAIYLQSLVLLPMILFSGTYFPIEFIPDFIEVLAIFSPITHGLGIVRSIQSDSINYNMFISFAVIFSYLVFMTNYATVYFERKVKSIFES
ncbi:MAG: ABC transporter permease [Bdellovibrionales bacterium]